MDEEKDNSKKETYYQRNKEKIKAYQKAYYQANKTEFLARNKRYYEGIKNGDFVPMKRGRKKKYHTEEERINAQKAQIRNHNKNKRKDYYEKNKEKIKAKQRDYYKKKNMKSENNLE